MQVLLRPVISFQVFCVDAEGELDGAYECAVLCCAASLFSALLCSRSLWVRFLSLSLFLLVSRLRWRAACSWRRAANVASTHAGEVLLRWQVGEEVRRQEGGREVGAPCCAGEPVFVFLPAFLLHSLTRSLALFCRSPGPILAHRPQNIRTQTSPKTSHQASHKPAAHTRLQTLSSLLPVAQNPIYATTLARPTRQTHCCCHCLLALLRNPLLLPQAGAQSVLKNFLYNVRHYYSSTLFP